MPVPLDTAPVRVDQLRTQRSIVDEWLDSVSSQHTRDAYRADWQQFTAWCATEGTDPVGFRRADAARFRDWLDGPQPGRNGRYGNATKARKLTAISSFYGYAAAERPDVVPTNPFAKIKRPRVSRKSRTRHLTPDEAYRFLEVAAEEGPLALALVDLMLSTALRTTEVTGASVTDLYRDGGDVLLRVTRKGDEEDDVLIPAETATTLYEYLDGRRTGPLFAFPRSPDRPPTRQQVQYLVAKLARNAGLVVEEGDRLVSPHSLRHTAATQAFAQGNDSRQVQALMGHADGRTTTLYDGGSVEAGRAAARTLGQLWHRAHPEPATGAGSAATPSVQVTPDPGPPPR